MGYKGHVKVITAVVMAVAAVVLIWSIWIIGILMTPTIGKDKNVTETMLYAMEVL